MRYTNEKRTAAGLALFLVAGAPAGAWAYGVEVPENGALSFGRGGATIARASDPSTVMHNVAGIVGLSGFQLSLSANVGSFSHCFQRAGSYDSSADVTLNSQGTVFQPDRNTEPGYYGQPYPQVCKDPSAALAVQLLGTYRINRYVGIGFGVFSPSTQGSGQDFPDTARTANGSLAPSPARYMLFHKNLLVLHPVVAVSVQPHRMIRFGLSVEPSIASLGFGLLANSDRTAPQSPSTDVRIDLSSFGFFMAGAVAVQITPIRYFSFAAQFHYNFPIDATGTATTTANYYASNTAQRATGTFDINSLQTQLPWTVRAGARFALPREGHHTMDDGSGMYDPMNDDVFDVEAAFTYERTSTLSETSLTNTGSIRISNSAMIPAPPTISISSALSDVFGVRLGGDYNIIPNQLAVRAGFSYETAGVSPVAAQIHLPAYAGASVHLGASYRWRSLTFNLAVGHFFFFDNDASAGLRTIVVPSDAMGRQIDPAACPEMTSQGNGTCTINRGIYSSSLTSGALSVTLHI